jgi:sugar transferase (PEP-CTERM system associated)
MQFVGLYSTPDELQPEGKYRDIEHGDLLAQVEALRATEVVIAARERRGGALPLRDLLDCKLEGIRVCDSVAFFEQEKGLLRLDDLRASWMIYGDGFNQGLARDVIKRIFDIVFSLVLLVVALPVMLIAACAVWLESRGPIIYRQERVGERGRSFQILKFRSMIQSAEKAGLPQWASPRDARITRVGRMIRATRIDELPQIFNVLLGEMSFVGPRPERPSFVTQLADQIRFYDMRHSLKPGITGWAQVRFHYGASIEDSVEKLQYDLYYVKNHSLFLDLLIILETVQVVIGRKGAR